MVFLETRERPYLTGLVAAVWNWNLWPML